MTMYRMAVIKGNSNNHCLTLYMDKYAEGLKCTEHSAVCPGQS